MVVVVPKFSVKEFAKTMNNVIDYSIGFLDGTQKGKNEFLKQLGNMTIEGLKRFIDIQAKLSPGALHHVYEWYKVGSPKGRLYDIKMVRKGDSIMFNSSFSQSRTLKKGSSEPFYDKATIMENGISVTIEPKNAKVLAFQIDGEDVFTPNPVTVDNPGGDDVEGSYEKVFNSFFKNYFSQSFLKASGIFEYLEKPKAFKNNLKSGAIGGKQVGYRTGYSWIINATSEVE